MPIFRLLHGCALTAEAQHLLVLPDAAAAPNDIPADAHDLVNAVIVRQLDGTRLHCPLAAPLAATWRRNSWSGNPGLRRVSQQHLRIR